jgi:hypothetical protein
MSFGKWPTKSLPGMSNLGKKAFKFARNSMPGEDTGGACDVNSIMPCKNNLTESCKEDDNSNDLFTCQKDQKKIDALKEKKDKAASMFSSANDFAKTKAKGIQGQLLRQGSERRMKEYQENPQKVVSSAYSATSGQSTNANNSQTVDECCQTFKAIIDMCNAQIAKCQASGCCSGRGGNKKSVKNTKRNNKVKSVKKKRSSQSGGKVHPWREHIKKTRLSNPGVKDFGQIIQMAKQTYKK